jgi:hypothetical protein
MVDSVRMSGDREALREAVYWGTAAGEDPPLLESADRDWISAMVKLGDRDPEGAFVDLANALHARPADTGIKALQMWVHASGRRRPTDDDVSALKSLADSDPGSVAAQVLYCRVLVRKGDTPAVEAELARLPESAVGRPSTLLAEAEVSAAQGKAQDALERLDQLRNATSTRSFALCTFEMILAVRAGANDRFQRAYVERSDLMRSNPYRWVPAIWMQLRWLTLLLPMLWVVGVIIDIATGASFVWILSLVLFVLYMVLHWHVLRSRRLTAYNLAILIVALLIALTLRSIRLISVPL